MQLNFMQAKNCPSVVNIFQRNKETDIDKYNLKVNTKLRCILVIFSNHLLTNYNKLFKQLYEP